MNQSSHDEYEEVESPFASKSSPQAPQRERLRTRKNVFNRPFATDSSHAPLLVETTGTRKSVGTVDNSELIQRRSSSLSETEIDYLPEDEIEDEEDYEVEKRPARASVVKKKDKTKKNILSKIAWSVIGLLVLRLICMDRGVWDYFVTESVIGEKREELASVQKENRELKTEITKIQNDPGFQRQLAKEHLGVIAVDEFLILFAGESDEPVESNTSI
jgi:cell division protein FtsB